MTTENNLSENEESKNSIEGSNEETSENTVPQEENQHDDAEHLEEEADTDISLADALKEMEKIINAPNAGEDVKKFNQLKEKASHYIHDEVEDKKHEYVEAGNAPENFSYEHPSQSKLSALVNIFREKHDNFQKGLEEEQKKNLEHRQGIIERLKNLYTNSEPNTNLFKSIREIKEDWSNAGQVAKSEFKILNNNYFHHLNQFYQMLDLNKEFLEQEYGHNLEKRQHIIARAKELENEPVIQKALNELQYLHKLWKEEAEPVAEEFREKTWEEFKEISNKIHERKSELSAAIETEQNDNLEKKNKIIEEIKKLSEPAETPNHNYWQNAIRRVEDLRSEFLKTGSVPRKLSNQNWNDFKTTLRNFNTTKNNYYKSLKGSQQTNLEEKLKLIQTAKDNMNNEEWDIAVPLFKKLQEDWKKIGHVPKSMTNKIWDEFRDACNTFFNNYREKSNASTDNWKENYKQKKELLEELKTISNDEGSIEKIETIKTAWNNVGKVPRDKISINSEFNKTLREKLKLNKINELELKEDGLSENQLTDKARKMKSQISDLESEIVKLENNLSFFNKPSRDNPLLADTFNTIDEKKAHLETLKQNLHNIIVGE
ncbi:DUF349 domain-containing protein [Chryseobacterium sp. PTM-20240506]|uniref:DUF349 domain-containing protein n=1 Tax=unclassified Chryseobacterium TaxID=2593645 RepID=UPI0023598B93|nr:MULTISPECIES: DUF349 domain-containing protein [unclassified Chryseobacterium]MDC8106697.1 DUF349 domain-containing protein [Chryseobacterium sp. B21-037]MDQ1806024.1 DUF349 domain-containing protein [Chryseobacterium sp. CKR4-1]WBV55914.1 DUF349 domain-containing protein [Chryseobacterium daecheongense]